jgi:hypothetical protein
MIVMSKYQFMKKIENETVQERKERIKNNKEWAKEAISLGALDFKNMPAYVRNDREIVTLAMKNDKDSLKYVGKKIKKDIDKVLGFFEKVRELNERAIQEEDIRVNEINRVMEDCNYEILDEKVYLPMDFKYGTYLRQFDEDRFQYEINDLAESRTEDNIEGMREKLDRELTDDEIDSCIVYAEDIDEEEATELMNDSVAYSFGSFSELARIRGLAYIGEYIRDNEPYIFDNWDVDFLDISGNSLVDDMLEGRQTQMYFENFFDLLDELDKTGNLSNEINELRFSEEYEEVQKISRNYEKVRYLEFSIKPDKNYTRNGDGIKS